MASNSASVSLAALDMCTGRNYGRTSAPALDSLAALDMCTGRNPDTNAQGRISESSGLGYVHWPELLRASALERAQSSGLGYVHWPEQPSRMP